MRARHVLGLVVAVLMLLFGGWLALTGMGYLGDSSATSGSWSFLGSLIAGLGVALGFTVVQSARR
ncbi:hypothetical protein [Nocardioides insulae]|uniref:hypothetical protein n=1 Tax=Nocardioides insulae TaxID=394734 RepID=UPI00040C3D30|nr:hypothetical protein [Nocardioides insulae]